MTCGKNLVKEPLDAGEEKSEEEQDVGEVLGELADGGLGAELLDVVDVVAGVGHGGGVGAALVGLGIR